MLKSRLLLTLAAAPLLTALAGAAFADTIKIGVNQPLTGAFAASGTYVVEGAKIAADEINAKGGVLGRKSSLSSKTTRAIRQKPPRSQRS